jgi:hypothetical protein
MSFFATEIEGIRASVQIKKIVIPNDKIKNLG